MKYNRYGFYKECAEGFLDNYNNIQQFKRSLQFRKGTCLEKWDKIFLKRLRKVNKPLWHKIVD